METRESILETALKRCDEWGAAVITCISNVSDLVAADAQYHNICMKKFFATALSAEEERGSVVDAAVAIITKDLRSYRSYHQIQQWLGVMKEARDWRLRKGSSGLVPITTLQPPAPDSAALICSILCVNCSGACGNGCQQDPHEEEDEALGERDLQQMVDADFHLPPTVVEVLSDPHEEDEALGERDLQQMVDADFSPTTNSERDLQQMVDADFHLPPTVVEVLSDPQESVYPLLITAEGESEIEELPAEEYEQDEGKPEER
ncbi:hypothetical protein PR048_028654, partial [Dryococelus australis]